MSKVPLCWRLLWIKGKQEGRKETLSQKQLGWCSLKRIEVIVLGFSAKVCKPYHHRSALHHDTFNLSETPFSRCQFRVLSFQLLAYSFWHPVISLKLFLRSSEHSGFSVVYTGFWRNLNPILWKRNVFSGFVGFPINCSAV